MVAKIFGTPWPDGSILTLTEKELKNNNMPQIVNKIFSTNGCNTMAGIGNARPTKDNKVVMPKAAASNATIVIKVVPMCTIFLW